MCFSSIRPPEDYERRIRSHWRWNELFHGGFQPATHVGGVPCFVHRRGHWLARIHADVWGFAFGPYSHHQQYHALQRPHQPRRGDQLDEPAGLLDLADPYLKPDLNATCPRAQRRHHGNS
jgi:hypothetical protein